MQLTPRQVNELLSIINRNQAILIASNFGLDFLSNNDRQELIDSGVDWENLYSEDTDSIYTSFHLGMLATSLQDSKALKHLAYSQLKEYVKGGNYIPITPREQSIIDSIKGQTLSDIRVTNGKIFQDINNVLSNQSLKSQKEFLTQKLSEGVKNKKSYREISNELHKLTGDWSRNFDRIVEVQCNNAFQTGRAQFFERTEGPDVLVYKKVFETACEHCNKAYLTKGLGSQPRIFKLSELKANGSNRNRKVKDWLPTLESLHPYCRCLLVKVPTGYKWNPEKKDFSTRDDKPILRNPRKGIRIKIGGIETVV